MSQKSCSTWNRTAWLPKNTLKYWLQSCRRSQASTARAHWRIRSSKKSTILYAIAFEINGQRYNRRTKATLPSKISCSHLSKWGLDSNKTSTKRQQTRANLITRSLRLNVALRTILTWTQQVLPHTAPDVDPNLHRWCTSSNRASCCHIYAPSRALCRFLLLWQITALYAANQQLSIKILASSGSALCASGDLFLVQHGDVNDQLPTEKPE